VPALAYSLLLAAVLIVALAAGGVAAIAGFGIGSLLTPLLALAYGTKVAVLLVALPHFAATVLRAWMLRSHVERRVLLTFGAASAVGGLGGALLHATFGSRILSVVLGLLLIFTGLSGLAGLSARFRINGAAWAFAAGIVSGGFGGVVGNQGGIRTAALLHFPLDRLQLVATATAIGVVVDLARIPVYLATGGAEILENWPMVIVAAIGVIAGTLLFTPLLRRVPEPIFRRAVYLLVALLGVAFLLGLTG
jgi:uncharacterized membrane protein YfcA